jgi:hypothetical protein
MIPGLVVHLWQSTLFVVAAWLLTLALRKSPARVRHWVWFAASAKFLIPFSLLVGLSALASWRAAPPVQPAWAVAVEQIGAPLTALPAVAAQAAVTTRNPDGNYIQSAELALWACGFAVIAACWLIRWKRIHALRRSATPASTPSATKFAVPVMASQGLVSSASFGRSCACRKELASVSIERNWTRFWRTNSVTSAVVIT